LPLFIESLEQHFCKVTFLQIYDPFLSTRLPKKETVTDFWLAWAASEFRIRNFEISFRGEKQQLQLRKMKHFRFLLSILSVKKVFFHRLSGLDLCLFTHICARYFLVVY
jgi:hypothetical protein